MVELESIMRVADDGGGGASLELAEGANCPYRLAPRRPARREDGAVPAPLEPRTPPPPPPPPPPPLPLPEVFPDAAVGRPQADDDAASSSAAPPSGIISSVPGISRPAPAVPEHGADVGSPPPASVIPTLTTGPIGPITSGRTGLGPHRSHGPGVPLVEHIPTGLVPSGAHSGRTTAGEVPLWADLAEDVESTRLSQSHTPGAPGGAGQGRILELWDGRRLTLLGTALIGRSPAARPAEAPPEHTLAIADPTRSVSKTHLAVGLDAAGVWVKDRGSTNGTTVTLADGATVECPPEQMVHAPSGATVAFGGYWFTVA